MPEPVPEWGCVMAARRRHWKEKNGRFWARLSNPQRLRPAFGGKSELLEPLGGDLRLADRNHAVAVARLQKLLDGAAQSLSLFSDADRHDDAHRVPKTDLTEEIATSLLWDRFATLLDDDTAKRTAMPTNDDIEAEREKVFTCIEASELDASTPISEQINGYLDFNLAAGARYIHEAARKRRL